MEIKSVGILTVATNKYVEYWEELATSLDECCPPDGPKVKMHVFTDQVERAELHARSLQHVSVETYEIESYKWPEATLFRYRIFEKYLPDIHEELLMHLDADMKIEKWFVGDIPSHLNQGIGLVSHPGYYRPKSWSKASFYLKNIRKIWADSRMRLVEGGIGSWDKNRDSLAFVSRRKRDSYVCGGTWMGSRKSIIKLVSELSQKVEEDQARDVIALWHDESHLNRWSAQNNFTLLNPEFCYDGSYPGLGSLTPLIRAIDKRIE